MAIDNNYWHRVFKCEFSTQLKALVDALERRVLPGFEGIEQEAEYASKEAWDAFMSAPATGDEDLAEFAEAAREIGTDHYLLLSGVRQAIVNLFTAALYHAFEQQLILFHRHELLEPVEANDAALFKLSELQKRLKVHGIDIKQLSSWPIVNELRLVANTVKHAEGESAKQLKKVRPDLFKLPGLPKLGEWDLHMTAPVLQPLVGQDVYVSISNIREYRDTLIKFWEQLSSAMQSPERTSTSPGPE